MITAPPPAPTAPDQLGSLIGDGVATVISGPIDQAMQAIWSGCAELLGQAFELVDKLSTFSISTTCDQAKPETCGSLPHLWPILVSLSTLIALGMFFWQITVASVRGGRGMMHAATGTVGYGLALAITVTAVASLLGAADGMTSLLLSQGVHASSSFNAAYKQLPFGQQALNGVKPVILGVVGFFGILPAALGYAVEMMFRQAAVTVLVATIPFTAAGLMARSTARWFWISARWILTAIILKPAFALVLVIGLTSVSDAKGVVGLLAGVAVLWVALFSPMALFRLLAFVDPATDTGTAFRDAASNLSSRFASPAPAGAESSNYSGAGAGGGSGTGDSAAGVSDLEQANTARFDGASTSAGDGSAPGISDVGMSPPPPAAHQTQPANQAASTSDSDPTTQHESSSQEKSSSQAEPTSQAGQGSAPAAGHYTDTQPAPHHPDPGTDPPDDPGGSHGGYDGHGGGESAWGGDGGMRPPGPPPTNPHCGSGSTATQTTQAAETSAVIV
jgi:hypothetical protein